MHHLFHPYNGRREHGKYWKPLEWDCVLVIMSSEHVVNKQTIICIMWVLENCCFCSENNICPWLKQDIRILNYINGM